jgi:putative FmdB family regulatory protein
VPTYDYQCRSCGAVTEVIHSMLEEGPTVCERCGGELRRILYPAGIIFKGTGFYATDSRSKSGDASSTAKKTDSAKAAPDAGPAKPSSDAGSSGEASSGAGSDTA